MRAGKLDRRITLYERVQSKKATGEIQNTLTATRTIWAGKTPQSVMERFTGAQVAAESTVGFRIRGHFTVTPSMELRWNGRRYDIVGVQEIGRKAGYDLMTRARAE